MSWPPKQRTAIFLDIKRRKGEKAAVEFMHRHGYPGDKPSNKDRKEALRRRKR